MVDASSVQDAIVLTTASASEAAIRPKFRVVAVRLCDVAYGSFTSILASRPDVCFTPDSDRIADALPCPKGAKNRPQHAMGCLALAVLPVIICGNDRW